MIACMRVRYLMVCDNASMHNTHPLSRSQLVVFVDGAEWHRSKDNDVHIIAPGPWPPGIHTVFASLLVSEIEHGAVTNRARQGQMPTSASSHFIIIDRHPHTLTNMSCSEDLSAEGRAGAGKRGAEERDTVDAAESRPGFGYGKWQEMRECLNGFLKRFPACAGAHIQLASLDAAHGLWQAAAERYAHASQMEAAAATVVEQQQRQAEMLSLQQEHTEKCAWRSYTQCSGPPDARTCKARNSSMEAGVAALVGEGEADMFLSIIMVGRHDNTQYCQSPADACLDRMRVSLSVLLNLLSKHKLAVSTELILVEWNPCYANGKAEEGACDARADGYLSLEQIVRDLVHAPPTPTSVRILYVSEEVHDSIYNPFDFDLMEFIGKNVAARRARGKYLLFANPDDVWSDSLVRRLSDRQSGLREDAVYATFRGNVRDHVPVAHGSHAASYERYVAANSESSEHQPVSVAHVAGHWRRASCHASDTEEEPMRGDKYGFFHDSAAGDFLLMSRRVVNSIRGYPEIPTNIMIDGTAIHAAAGVSKRVIDELTSN